MEQVQQGETFICDECQTETPICQKHNNNSNYSYCPDCAIDFDAQKVMLDIFVVISNETKAWEQIGYDVDVWEDNQNGRVEELSKVGFPTKPEAELYVEELKSKHNVVRVDYQK